MVGATVAWWLPAGASLWLPVGFFAVLTALFAHAFGLRGGPLATLALVILSVTWHAQSERRDILHAISNAHGNLENSFEVIGEAQARPSKKAGECWVSFSSRHAKSPLRIVFSQATTNTLPQPGELWRCRGHYQGPTEENRVAMLWIRGRNAFATREREAPVWKRRLAMFRRELSRRLGLGLEDRPLLAGLNRAILLGERASLPHDVRATFVRAGTVHVFAISGLHVAVVASIIVGALLLVGFPYRYAGFALLPLLTGYVIMIGSPPSAVRAAAMAILYAFAPFTWRKPDALAVWNVVFVAFAVLDPYGFIRVGSLLSFAVTLGILLFIRWAKFIRWRPVMLLGVPLAAWAAGVPIVAHCFSRVTPGGLLANIALVPLAGAAVTTSAAGLLLGCVSDALAAHANNLAGLLLSAMTGLSWAVSRIPGADFEVEPWPIPLCLAWYAVGILLAVLVRSVILRRRRLI